MPIPGPAGARRTGSAQASPITRQWAEALRGPSPQAEYAIGCVEWHPQQEQGQSDNYERNLWPAGRGTGPRDLRDLWPAPAEAGNRVKSEAGPDRRIISAAKFLPPSLALHEAVSPIENRARGAARDASAARQRPELRRDRRGGPRAIRPRPPAPGREADPRPRGDRGGRPMSPRRNPPGPQARRAVQKSEVREICTAVVPVIYLGLDALDKMCRAP